MDREASTRHGNWRARHRRFMGARQDRSVDGCEAQRRARRRNQARRDRRCARASFGQCLHEPRRRRRDAHVGQWMLHRAWTRAQASGKPERPWPWADTQPIARLLAPQQRVDLLVLAGASGRTLAWGPGHLDGSAAVGSPGNAVLSAHRDTHFRFLARVAIGDRLIVERADGSRVAYRVRDIAIVDARALVLPRDTERPTLTLVTCYPFDALVPGGPLRYVVTAEVESRDTPLDQG